MVEIGNFEAKVISSSSDEYADGTVRGNKICRLVLSSHIELDEWLVSCQFTRLGGSVYKIKRVLVNGCRFGNTDLVFEVAITEDGKFWKAEKAMVLVTRKEG